MIAGRQICAALCCLSAAVAWRHQATFLACDVDLDRVARGVRRWATEAVPAVREAIN